MLEDRDDLQPTPRQLAALAAALHVDPPESLLYDVVVDGVAS